MLKLQDFFHLAQLDPLIEQLVAGGPGLVVVADLDAHSTGVVATGRLGPAAAFCPVGAARFSVHHWQASVYPYVQAPRTGAQCSSQVRQLAIPPPRTWP